MASETIVSGPDQYGNDKYKLLYEEIMYDIGKLAMLDRSYLLLKPEVPLFVISIRLKARPAAKKIGDVAMTRAERGNVYVSISDEMYAPGTLQSLWKAYGRDNVQQTRPPRWTPSRWSPRNSPCRRSSGPCGGSCRRVSGTGASSPTATP